jgi:transcriptional regulator with XRE-family HTH domain
MRLQVAVGQTLRDIRQERKLTLRRASALTLCSIGHLSDVERAAAQATDEMLESIAKGYDLSTIELLNRVVQTLNREEQQCSQQ